MNIEELRNTPVFDHFYEICQLPHGSGNEQTLSDYLLQWAHQAGYDAVQDGEYNVFIKAPGTAGLQDAPAVMLQAHMDMVCEKKAGSLHDFGKDPIPWVIEDDLLTTGGETTLGADNGIGVALAMTLLGDKTLVHPPLEVLFTTNEEEDFSGASAFAAEDMQAGCLINLDHVREDETVCGSCGGMRVDIKIPLEMTPIPDENICCRITIHGLKGGHSGDDIHLGRGNANALMGRVLKRLQQEMSYQITEMKGGSYRLAIPREATWTIALNKADEAKLPGILKELELEFRQELPLSGGLLHIDAKIIDPDKGMLLAADPQKVITAIALTPDGICKMNEAFPGIVDTSDNLGEIYLEQDRLHFVLEIRSATESLRDDLYDRMKLVANLLGGEAACCDAYPSWHFQAGSPLQNLCARVYQRRTGKAMQFMTVHAGLETGYFLEKKPSIDAVSIGPDIYDFHSPSERVSISSTLRVYEYLKELLAEIGRG